MKNTRQNICVASNRQEFRMWLSQHHSTEKECWLDVKKGKPIDEITFWYIDAVEEALCFGWIDGTYGVVNNRHLQRFSPRSKKSQWTELNKERVRRLEKLGLMTEAGRCALPAMGPRSFKIDKDIEVALKEARAWSQFKRFPTLYQRVRAYNVAYYKNDNDAYNKAISTLITNTKIGKMYGQWNDWGRLIEY